MPSQRRIRTTIILSVTALLVLIYISTGSSSTRTSEFYTRTLAALDQKKPGGGSGSGSGSDAGGGARLKVADITTHDEPDPGPGPGVRGSSNGQKAPDQRGGAAVAAPKKDAITGADIGDTDGDTEQRDDDTDGPPRVHRKKRPVQDDDDVRSGPGALREQKPGKLNSGASAGKVVEIPDDAPPAADAGKDAARAADGVAKVGNTGSRVKKPDGAQKALLDIESDTGKDVGKASGGEKVQAPDEIEVELDAILKRSPIIIFSKTYCRFSKNAKRILLKAYKVSFIIWRRPMHGHFVS